MLYFYLILLFVKVTFPYQISVISYTLFQLQPTSHIYHTKL